MVYARRSTYRRKGRRGNRSLSTRRIFNNKSAKAQAKQIYALRKSINRVARKCRPEIKVLESTPIVQQFTATYEDPGMGTVFQNSWSRYSLALPTRGDSDGQFIGNLVSMLPFSWFINAQYGRKTNTSNGIPYYNLVNEGNGAAMRIIAVQAKQPLQSAPEPTELFPDFQDGSHWQQTISNMNCSYRNGITSSFNILYDKVKYINQNRPIFNKRLKIKPASRKLFWEQLSWFWCRL